MKLIPLFCSLFFVVSCVLDAAVFNWPSHLINIPIYRSFNQYDLEVGMSSGTYSREDLLGIEFDLKASYALTNRALLGMNLMNKSELVFHLHYNFLDRPNLPWKVSGGIVNIPISGHKTLSSFSESDVIQENYLSPFVVVGYFTKLVHFHLGVGGNQFQYADKDSARLSAISGPFFGLEVPVYNSKVSLEFDGKDFNAGISLLLTRRNQMFASFTELGHSSDQNPQYNNQPVRWISFGITHKFNVKEPQDKNIEIIEKYNLSRSELQKIHDDIRLSFYDELLQWRLDRQKYEEEIAQLKYALQEDIRYIDQKDLEVKEDLRQHYLSTSQDISEKVLSYYYQSFEYFSVKEYYKAIELLEKAILLNPYLPQLYVRLGSIYYELELVDMAIKKWEKVLELDPDNVKLKQLISVLKS